MECARHELNQSHLFAQHAIGQPKRYNRMASSITWKYCVWVSFVKTFLNRKLKVPVTYLEVEFNVDSRKHSKTFSIISRTNAGTRRRNAERNRKPWTLANLLLTAVRETCNVKEEAIRQYTWLMACNARLIGMCQRMNLRKREYFLRFFQFPGSDNKICHQWINWQELYDIKRHVQFVKRCETRNRNRLQEFAIEGMKWISNLNTRLALEGKEIKNKSMNTNGTYSNSHQWQNINCTHSAHTW